MSEMEQNKFWKKVREINDFLLKQLTEGNFYIDTLQEFEYIHIVSDVASVSSSLTGIVSAYESGTLTTLDALEQLKQLEDGLKEVEAFDLFNPDEVKITEPKASRKIDDDEFSF